jgi:transposase
METLVERCAGLDVHKDSVTACVRVPDDHGGRHAETRSFSTTTAGLLRLVEWLASFG